MSINYIGTDLNKIYENTPYGMQTGGNNTFTKIINPNTGKKVSIYSKTGGQVIHNYLFFLNKKDKFIGGASLVNDNDSYFSENDGVPAPFVYEEPHNPESEDGESDEESEDEVLPPFFGIPESDDREPSNFFDINPESKEVDAPSLNDSDEVILNPESDGEESDDEESDDEERDDEELPPFFGIGNTDYIDTAESKEVYAPSLNNSDEVILNPESEDEESDDEESEDEEREDEENPDLQLAYNAYRPLQGDDVNKVSLESLILQWDNGEKMDESSDESEFEVYGSGPD